MPKQLHGMDLDATPTPEVKKFQREFFKSVYRILCSADTGPRLPTLLLSLGRRRARALLVGDTMDPRTQRPGQLSS